MDWAWVNFRKLRGEGQVKWLIHIWCGQCDLVGLTHTDYNSSAINWVGSAQRWTVRRFGIPGVRVSNDLIEAKNIWKKKTGSFAISRFCDFETSREKFFLDWNELKVFLFLIFVTVRLDVPRLVNVNDWIEEDTFCPFKSWFGGTSLVVTGNLTLIPFNWYWFFIVGISLLLYMICILINILLKCISVLIPWQEEFGFEWRN